MAAYVVLIGTEEKHGTLEPDVIGPFKDEAELEAWLTGPAEALQYRNLRPDVASWLRTEADLWGGYPALHVVTPESATDPGRWEAENDWRLDENFGLEVPR